MRSLFVASVVLLGLAAEAHADDVPACAQYQEALAYNACLARLGPKAGATRATAAPAYDAHGRTVGALAVTRNKRGRVEAVFAMPASK